MRRTIILCAGALLAVMLLAPPAIGASQGRGCPAGASVWSMVSYITSPDQGDYLQTSFYHWYFDEHPQAAAALAALHPELTVEQQYFVGAAVLDSVDKNQDNTVCVFWIGGVGNPDQTRGFLYDSVISFVENNTALG